MIWVRVGNRKIVLAALLMLGLVLAGCAQQDNGAEPAEAGPSTEEEHGEVDEDISAFGEPADAADADRTITISMTDALRFEPDEIEVAAGETITFVLQSTSSIVHEFTIGDEEFQEHHEEEMMEMRELGQTMMMDEPNAISIPSGQTRELTWRFTQPGELLYGCHEPGHYPAGMVGTINVTS